MQIFPLSLMAIIERLPESPHYYLMHDQKENASNALEQVYGKGDEQKQKFDELVKASEDESGTEVKYWEMLFKPSSEQFHPTMLTVMAQVNQALTGYGAVSVYGPQIFEVSTLPFRAASCAQRHGT